MRFELPPLPFKTDALAPHISARTIGLHYGRHHKGYVGNLNRLTAGKPEANLSLTEVVLTAAAGPILNNAAQAWNHAFFWNSLTPKGGGAPNGALAAAAERDFGSFGKLTEKLTKAANSLFGSGWAWLVLEHGTLKVTQTANANTPIRLGHVPLLTLDVWEHAYYVDYQNARPKFVEAFLGNLANWDFAAANLANAARQEPRTVPKLGQPS